jgi:hypothetical protein
MKFDFYYLQKLLCAGVLGKSKGRKLVPTRWAITAMDRMVADEHLTEVKNKPELNNVLLFSNEYLYNHFEVLLLPGKWEFEQFECWSPDTIWTSGESTAHIAHEYEPFEGRSDYAETEGGGYYAGRMACAEGLKKLGRQGRVVVFREILEGYKVPVGVWQIRQSLRHTLGLPPKKFGSVPEALADAGTRLKQPLSAYLKRSRILGQKKIFEFF